jgi:hypothetical protein
VCLMPCVPQLIAARLVHHEDGLAFVADHFQTVERVGVYCLARLRRRSDAVLPKCFLSCQDIRIGICRRGFFQHAA